MCAWVRGVHLVHLDGQMSSYGGVLVHQESRVYMVPLWVRRPKRLQSARKPISQRSGRLVRPCVWCISSVAITFLVGCVAWLVVDLQGFLTKPCDGKPTCQTMCSLFRRDEGVINQAIARPSFIRLRWPSGWRTPSPSRSCDSSLSLSLFLFHNFQHLFNSFSLW